MRRVDLAGELAPHALGRDASARRAPGGGLRLQGLVLERRARDLRRADRRGPREAEEASCSHIAAVDGAVRERFSDEELATLAELLGRLPGAGGDGAELHPGPRIDSSA